MDRTYIDRYLVVDRYVAGDLSERELGDFEERLVWDQSLVDEVDLAEKLRQGLQVAGREASPAPPQRRQWLFQVPLAAAASFALGILATSVFFSDTSYLQENVVTAVVELDVLRGGAQQQIAVNPETFVVLMVSVDAGYPSYAAVIRTQGAPEPIWTQDGLQRGYARSLSIGVPSSVLQPGNYVLSVSGRSHESDVTIREINFEAVVSN